MAAVQWCQPCIGARVLTGGELVECMRDFEEEWSFRAPDIFVRFPAAAVGFFLEEHDVTPLFYAITWGRCLGPFGVSAVTNISNTRSLT